MSKGAGLMAGPSGRDLLRADEVLEEYPISKSTLNRVTRDGRLRFYRLPGGHLRYFDRSDVEALFVASDGEQEAS
jgi:excisionase family DNA binding protein